MSNYLFVYGTLLGEFAPPEIAETVKKMEYVSNGFVYGHLYNLGEYPGAILNDSIKSKIFGRIYKLPSDEDILQKLDEYEGFFPHQSAPNLFVRKETCIFLENGKQLNGWIYEYNRRVKSSALIKSGDYSKIAV